MNYKLYKHTMINENKALTVFSFIALSKNKLLNFDAIRELNKSLVLFCLMLLISSSKDLIQTI